MIKNVKRVFEREKAPFRESVAAFANTDREDVLYIFTYPIGKQTMYDCALSKMRYDNRDFNWAYDA